MSVRARTEILVERLDDALAATSICLPSERPDLLSTSAVAFSAEPFVPHGAAIERVCPTEALVADGCPCSRRRGCTRAPWPGCSVKKPEMGIQIKQNAAMLMPSIQPWSGLTGSPASSAATNPMMARTNRAMITSIPTRQTASMPQPDAALIFFLGTHESSFLLLPRTAAVAATLGRCLVPGPVAATPLEVAGGGAPRALPRW